MHQMSKILKINIRFNIEVNVVDMTNNKLQNILHNKMR